MSANVAITDTFDQWRTKANEWITMTQSAGSSNFLKICIQGYLYYPPKIIAMAIALPVEAFVSICV